MIRQILTLSQAEARDFNPSPRDAIVSITGRGAERLPLTQFARIFRAQFDDNQTAGTTPDSGGLRGESLTPTEARVLLDVVLRWHGSAEVSRLFVHCLAGVSRSVSVAAALRAILGLPGEAVLIHNPRAYNALVEVALRRGLAPVIAGGLIVPPPGSGRALARHGGPAAERDK